LPESEKSPERESEIPIVSGLPVAGPADVFPPDCVVDLLFAAWWLPQPAASAAVSASARKAYRRDTGTSLVGSSDHQTGG
jgi:hypothetical protein